MYEPRRQPRRPPGPGGAGGRDLLTPGYAPACGMITCTRPLPAFVLIYSLSQTHFDEVVSLMAHQWEQVRSQIDTRILGGGGALGACLPMAMRCPDVGG